MKEMLDLIDNWTLIKIFGGLSIVLSTLVVFIAHFIKDYFINKWKHRQEKEIENLKSQAMHNNSVLNNLTNSITDIYLSSSEKRTNYLEKVWTSMLDIRNNIPGFIFMSNTILNRNEYKDIIKKGHFADSIKNFNSNNILDSQTKPIEEVKRIRPFIGENLWNIFYAYQAFLGRQVYLMGKGIDTEKMIYWIDDISFNKNILGLIIPDKELNKLMSIENLAFQNILNYLEYKAIVEISEHLSGKKISGKILDEAINQTKRSKEYIENIAKY